MVAVKDVDWTPRLRNGIYCSPRCGCDCTKAAYDKAVKDSAALAKRMGDGWEPEVWENMGWHWRIDKGVFHLWPPKTYAKDDQYSAWFNGAHQFIACAKVPEDALGFVIQDARTFIRRMENELAEPQP